MKIRGFTLLEVMIAMAVLSVVLTALYGTFFLSERAVRGVDDSLLKLHEMRTALYTMGREVEASIKGGTGFIIKDKDMYGRAASEAGFVTFYSPAPGPAKVSYYVEEEAGKMNLYKSFSTIAAKESMKAPMLEDIESFAVEALDNASWIRTWNRPDMPVEIRLILSARLNGRVVTLTESVRPRIGSRI